MAFDLTARLRLVDMFTGPMRQADNAAKTFAGTAAKAGQAVGRMDSENNRAAKSFRTLKEAAASGSSGIGTFIRQATVLAGTIGGLYAAKETVSNALTLSSNAEQANIAFKTMLGDGEKAKTFLGSLADFAQDTPFDLPQLRDASKRMLAFGFSAEQVVPTLTAVGDASAGLGLGQEGINRITLALGQMRAKSKVSGDEMLQLTEAGIPAWQILADKMHTTTAAVMKLSEKGVIPADKAIQALVDGMEKRFPNLMAEFAKTNQGMFEKMKDTFNNKLLVKFGDGIGAALKPRFEMISKWIDDNKDTIERWGNAIQDVATRATDWIADKFEKVMGYVQTHYLNNPEFNALDFSGKVEFVFNDLKTAFNKWYDAEGKSSIEKAAGSITQTLTASLAAATEPLIEIGTKLGIGIAKGVVIGFANGVKKVPILGSVIGAIKDFGGDISKFIGAYDSGGAGGLFDSMSKQFMDNIREMTTVANDSGGFGKDVYGPPILEPSPDGSHAGGLDRVPYDGYTARLHAGERVQTKAEADATRNGTLGNVTIQVNGTVREEADIQRIVNEIVRGLDGLQGAVAQ